MRVQVTIQGLTSLLMNRFAEGDEVAVGTGTSPAFHGDKGTPRDQAERKAYKCQDGTLYVPASNIFACIIAAGIFHKIGKKQLTTRDTSLIPAGVTMEDLICPLNTNNWEVDTRSVVNPSTKGRRLCHRPRVDNWSLSFTIDIDISMFGPNIIRNVIDDAGKKIGLGDYRPQRKGPFGKFVVTNWKEIVVKVA